MSDMSGSWDSEELSDQQGDTTSEVQSSDVVRLRVGGMTFNQAFTSGDVVVTRGGTDVPASQAQQIIDDARVCGVQVEVVPE